MSWLTTEAMPPEKSTPITWSFGIGGRADSDNGSASGSSTRISVSVRC